MTRLGSTLWRASPTAVSMPLGDTVARLSSTLWRASSQAVIRPLRRQPGNAQHFPHTLWVVVSLRTPSRGPAREVGVGSQATQSLPCSRVGEKQVRQSAQGVAWRVSGNARGMGQAHPTSENILHM